MTTTVTVRWVAASDAYAGTDYRIEADYETAATFAEVVTQAASDRGDGEYTPYATTLDGALTASGTTVALTDGSDFLEDDRIIVDGEMIVLGSKVTHTFSGCTRGAGCTLPIAHDTLAVVSKAHEIYEHTLTWPVGRYVVRYRIYREYDDWEGPPSEALALNPPVPATSNLCCVYGIVEDLQGVPKSSVSISMSINNAGNYGQDTGENIRNAAQAATSDADGFWYFMARRDVLRQGGGVITLVIDGQLTWTVSNIPDQDSVNFLET